MERKIGDTFEFEGKTFRVKEDKNWTCHGCIFNNRCTLSVKKTAGECEANCREDNKNVVFVEVREQPQKTEEIKERKIGEVFEYEGHKLKVTDEDLGCHRCFFYTRGCIALKMRGSCTADSRTDRKSVIFVEVKDEQPQLNLCEILKNCPKGTELWSDDYGKVEFLCIDTSLKHPIKIIRTDGNFSSYTKEGWCNINFPASCLLWPSRDCRDWSKFTAPRLKKERFDPKTLKAFDKILIYSCGRWEGSFFNRLLIQSTGKIGRVLTSCGSSETYCVPYNDDTKHLLGTKDEAPDFYRYWED